jgi:hypothetical protein
MFLHEWLPWESAEVRKEYGLEELRGYSYKEAFKSMRLEKGRHFDQLITNRFNKYMSKVRGFDDKLKSVADSLNPFQKAFQLLEKIDKK